MPKAIAPFSTIENQRVWSIVIVLLSIFLVFYTPSFINIDLVIIDLTSNIIGIIIFLIAVFYFLKTII